MADRVLAGLSMYMSYLGLTIKLYSFFNERQSRKRANLTFLNPLAARYNRKPHINNSNHSSRGGTLSKKLKNKKTHPCSCDLALKMMNATLHLYQCLAWTVCIRRNGSENLHPRCGSFWVIVLGLTAHEVYCGVLNQELI